MKILCSEHARRGCVNGIIHIVNHIICCQDINITVFKLGKEPIQS